MKLPAAVLVALIGTGCEKAPSTRQQTQEPAATPTIQLPEQPAPGVAAPPAPTQSTTETTVEPRPAVRQPLRVEHKKMPASNGDNCPACGMG